MKKLKFILLFVVTTVLSVFFSDIMLIVGLVALVCLVPAFIVWVIKVDSRKSCKTILVTCIVVILAVVLGSVIVVFGWGWI